MFTRHHEIFTAILKFSCYFDYSVQLHSILSLFYSAPSREQSKPLQQIFSYFPKAFNRVNQAHLTARNRVRVRLQPPINPCEPLSSTAMTERRGRHAYLIITYNLERCRQPIAPFFSLFVFPRSPRASPRGERSSRVVPLSLIFSAKRPHPKLRYPLEIIGRREPSNG